MYNYNLFKTALIYRLLLTLFIDDILHGGF